MVLTAERPTVPNGARRTRQPDRVPVQLATLVERPPAGEAWLNEIKLDGYRLLCRLRHGKATLFSRNGIDWTERFAAVAAAAESLPARDAWLDGEACVMLRDGRSSFQALQTALSEGRDADVVYVVFDLLYRDGYDLTRLPLLKRKEALAALLSGAPRTLRYGDHLRGQGEAFFRRACEFGLEGVVSKRGDRPHHAGRGRDWLKIKCRQRQEFVIGGYTEPSGGRSGFGALLLGEYDDGALRFAGRVGSGFDQRTLADLMRRLNARATDRCPFAAKPPGRGLHWVRPELVAEVAYSDRTRNDVLRQPSFQGLREDKPARQVHREMPVPPPRPGIKIALSHPDKVLYADTGLTKRDLAAYYVAVSELMLPQLVRRPLTLLRCPDGREAACFFQKHADESMPRALGRVAIDEDGQVVDYLTADSMEAVLALVQMGVLEIHIWCSRADRLDYPDRLVFDLDPDADLPWQNVVDAARLLHARLQSLGLQSFPKTTGGKGLHVVVPIVRRHHWHDVYAFSRAVARELARGDPRHYTAHPGKAARRGKVYIDYLRNMHGATAIAEYSTRARPGAPVAVPIGWRELSPQLVSNRFTVKNLATRLHRLDADPWEGYAELRQSLTTKMKRELGLIGTNKN